MKYLILSVLITLPLIGFSQREVISETDTIIVSQDTLYFLLRTTVSDNGTAINDTATTKKFLGDSTQAAAFVYNAAWDIANIKSAAMRRAFANSIYNREYANLSDLWLLIADTTLASENIKRLLNYYQGRYRIAQAGQTPLWANLIQLPSGAIRLESETDQTRYNIQPMTRNYFRINLGGTWYDMHYSFNNANEKRVYEDEGRALGPRTILITKQ